MKELLPLILPVEILDHFEIVNVCNTSDKIDIYLDEKNIPHKSLRGRSFIEGFYRNSLKSYRI